MLRTIAVVWGLVLFGIVASESLGSTTKTLEAAESSNLPRKFMQFMSDTYSNFETVARGPTSERNDRPLIAILAQPVHGETPTPEEKYYDDKAYIAASYVKYVEASGARAVPIVYTMSPEEITRRFNAVNGLLLPGGGSDTCNGPYADAGRLLLNLALKANDQGHHFPVWGTCLGFEQLAKFFADDCSICDATFDSENFASPLDLTPDAHTSRMLSPQSLNSEIMMRLIKSAKPLAMENHMAGVPIDRWNKSQKIRDFFHELTYSIDRHGEKYVSTIEAWNYPIYATQWHPEKNNFEWTSDLEIPHGEDGVMLSQTMANFFVSEARKSNHRPASHEEELKLLMYNYSPTFTYKTWPTFHFDQVYFFEKNESIGVIEKSTF
mmetsp:Transcript_1556/g.2226  ORF Transcript_1556/g.2226 Transcript_1556/m.2226 type:complete len:380 (+) Transcript_1556:30-1169(+)|eukprot:CAMPEP_0196585436 /NCGR_PEP_ID=MMETSP1081-20130531/50636_1 /TAXON_ID=36882 /ORGANISM="Pyramimonas amylifera, Strain CCMP720" /LENGTH=379 /DNA_ID=CAMNT_0041906973 /DNA_START=23 /DNA_END=1162 /DNA_ORIENTATION=+